MHIPIVCTYLHHKTLLRCNRYNEAFATFKTGNYCFCWWCSTVLSRGLCGTILRDHSNLLAFNRRVQRTRHAMHNIEKVIATLVGIEPVCETGVRITSLTATQSSVGKLRTIDSTLEVLCSHTKRAHRDAGTLAISMVSVRLRKNEIMNIIRGAPKIFLRGARFFFSMYSGQ